jgi:hypothetical protein
VPRSLHACRRSLAHTLLSQSLSGAWCSSHIAVLPSPIPHPKLQLGRRGRPWLRNCLSGRSGRQAALPNHLSHAIDCGRQLQRELVGANRDRDRKRNASCQQCRRHPSKTSHNGVPHLHRYGRFPPLCFSPQRVISIWFGPATPLHLLLATSSSSRLPHMSHRAVVSEATVGSQITHLTDFPGGLHTTAMPMVQPLLFLLAGHTYFQCHSFHF